MNAALERRRPLSLNSRVMLFVAIAISTSLLIIGYLVEATVKRHFAVQDSEELLVITHAVEEALVDAINANTSLASSLYKAVSGHHGVYFQVWEEKQQLIYGPEELREIFKTLPGNPVDQIEIDSLYKWETNEVTYRGSVTNFTMGDRKFQIVAAIDMNFHLHFLEGFRQTLWLIMTFAGALTLLAAWFGVRQGHAPLRALSEEIQGIKAESLEVRLDNQIVPTELVTLVDSFNRMISRLEDSFVRLSHFSADIAHELRTPLTNLITQTQVGLSKSRDLKEYRELLYSNLEEQERLTKMVNDMLWLAQSENGLLKLELEKLDSIDEVKVTFEFFEAYAEEKGITLKIEGSPSIVFGDRAMLRRVFSNLISNAIRHTHPGNSVIVRVWENDEKVKISVKNPGTQISSEHLPHVFDRFYRVDPSRQRQSEGAGLGLAIVKSIVEVHKGNITVTSEKGVTSFIMAFPKVKTA
ncbi:MAG: heavy metal sensor histidine kinase [Pseudomonadales bacterium]|nr:heavy metal sensor histidine kinase [Pseudomonadales bacterium]